MAVFEEGKTMVRSILGWVESKAVVIPSFQRKSVWNNKKKSNLILSLINYFMPPIIFYRNNRNELVIVDGLQRVSTIIEFISDGFKLKIDVNETTPQRDLEVINQINGKKFSKLPEDIQNKILNTLISYIIIRDTDMDTVRNIFKLINSNPTPLNAMELRYAINYGKLMEGLTRFVNEEAEFLKTFFKRKMPHNRMKDVEYILRIFGFYKEYDDPYYEKSLSNFLDYIAQAYKDEDVEPFTLKLMEVLDELLGEGRDLKALGNNHAWFDVIGITMGYAENEGVDVDINQVIDTLQQRTDFIDNITQRSNAKPYIVKERVSIINNVLRELYGDTQKGQIQTEQVSTQE